MIELRDLTLQKRIPQNLLRDEQVLHLAQALQRPIQNVSAWAYKLNYTMHMEELPEEIIDHLLWEHHIGPSEGLKLAKTKAEKIKLLNAAIELHRTKGTPYAIEKVLETVNLKGEVLEWWQYDADPYHFLVELDLTDKVEHIDDVREMVLEYKNTRSWFDGFVMIFGDEHILHIDQTYDYPVYYPYCNEVMGEAEFTLFKDALDHLDQTYDYEVELWVNEVYVTTTPVDGIYSDNSYTYAIEYGTCGEMETLPATLTTESSFQSLQPNTYNYPTHWLICGDFECGEDLT